MTRAFEVHPTGFDLPDRSINSVVPAPIGRNAPNMLSGALQSTTIASAGPAISSCRRLAVV
jgi:hypothetical protein